MARRGKRQVREGRSLSLQQSRPFLSSAEAHLAAISARLHPVIYTVFPQCFVWFCAVERTKAHLSAPLRAGSVGTFLGPSQSKGTSSGAAVALRGERSTWQQAWKTAAEVTQSKLCNAQQRVSHVWSSAVGLFLFSHKTPVEDKYSVSFGRVTSTAIPFLLFPPADGDVQSLFRPHAGFLVGEKREFSCLKLPRNGDVSGAGTHYASEAFANLPCDSEWEICP